MRILFCVSTRRGLGHVVRAGILADAVQEVRPEAEIVVAVSHPVPRALLGRAGVRTLIADPRDPADLARILASEPDVLVLDTVLGGIDPGALTRPGPPALALVLREVRPAVLDELRSEALLDRVERILIPHDPRDFDPGLPRTVHVGTIARCVPPRVSPRGRSLPLWVTTAGGGGHRELVEPFLRMAVEAEERLRARGLCVRHVLVPGPRFVGRLPEPRRCEVRRFEPRLPELLAEADLVVSRAGYNTVHELLGAGTPFVLVPGDPGLDDQTARANRLRERGRAAVAELGDVAGLVGILERWIVDPSCRPCPSPARGGDGTAGGAIRAARELVALGERGGRRRGISRAGEARGNRGSPALPDDELRALLGEGGADEGLRITREPMGLSREGGRIERIEVCRGGEVVGRFVAKSYPDGTGRTLAEVFGDDRARARPDRIPVPRILGYWEPGRVLVMEEAPGRRLDQLLGTRAAGQAFRETGKALARLHRLSPGGLPALSMGRLLGSLRPPPGRLLPAAGVPAGEIEEWLRLLPDPFAGCRVLCHRDLHPRQVFVARSGATLVDLDRCGIGHPSLDLANLEVYLEVRHPALDPGIVASFREGYLRGGGTVDEAAESVYRVFTRLRLAVKAVRERGRSGPEMARILVARCRSEMRRYASRSAEPVS